MNAVLVSLSKAVSQLGDPAIVRVAVKSIVITLLIFVAGGVGLYFGLAWFFAWLGWEAGGFAQAAAAAIIALIAFWFLFRIIALAVLQFFADEIVAAVEARHYPHGADRARALPLHRDIANSLRGFGRAVSLNLLALPVAAVLLFTGLGPAIVFLLVNAVLLGRELTDMTWLRQSGGLLSPSPVKGSSRFLLGAVVAAMMLIPFVNLIAAIVGAAAGTHLTHDAMRRKKAADA
ncbi:EI24 domain-containing protein [Erythrobacter ani]|uniref:EI24 domain-containing protein n=1 Tax=Erythrobacter ani TaxID=2827235 RepID=A0ABS6SKL1_9SPHN|nr:EI24 domain-containing protein [Erythrobacter ani]